jgi:hypothetical protein
MAASISWIDAGYIGDDQAGCDRDNSGSFGLELLSQATEPRRGPQPRRVHFETRADVPREDRNPGPKGRGFFGRAPLARSTFRGVFRVSWLEARPAAARRVF